MEFSTSFKFFSRENTADSTSDKEHENATELAAEALADVIFQWKNWVYRRVDSVHPSEGARGRLRHSMDCEPPPDPRLAYNEVERRYNDINDVKGQLMVPLAFIEKARCVILMSGEMMGRAFLSLVRKKLVN